MAEMYRLFHVFRLREALRSSPELQRTKGIGQNDENLQTLPVFIYLITLFVHESMASLDANDAMLAGGYHPSDTAHHF